MSHPSCAPSCDSSNETLASSLNNFITQFFGTVTKTCVNNQVVWTLPCDLADGMACYPRLANEGVACYILRLFDLFGLVAYGSWDINVTYCKNTFVTFGGQGYVSLGTTTGQQPDLFPASWHLYIAQGPAGPPGASPLTTKGDVFVYGVSDDRLPVGPDNTVAIADSTQALGLRYGFPASSDTASNLGVGNGVFASKAGPIFQFKSLIAGTNVTITPTGTDITIAATSATGLLTEYYESPAQVITMAGSITLAHGLTSIPLLIQSRIRCTTAELNYSIGDEVIVDNDAQETSFYGISVVPDATNINIRYAIGTGGVGPFVVINKTTGVPNSITPANWEYVVRAWK